jgi:hypothetical protein
MIKRKALVRTSHRARRVRPIEPVDASIDIAARESETILLQFSEEQGALHEKLTELSPDLARMYVGAMRILNDERNPDSHALAAHGFRELMEKLARYQSVPMTAGGETLTEKVRALGQAWRRCHGGSKDKRSRPSSGRPDRVAVFLEEVDQFFKWLSNHRPTRSEVATKLMAKLEVSSRALPDQLQKINARYWETIRDFFENTCHHRVRPTRAEFDGWVFAIERFLLDRLAPRTTRDFESIDAIQLEAKKQ